MRMLFEILLDPWLNRRAVNAILSLLMRNEHIDISRVVIYRVPLPPEVSISIGYDYEEVRAIRRSSLEWFGLGPRLYVIDGAPGALLAKPTAWAVFRGLSQEPEMYEEGRWHLLLNGAEVPFGNEAKLRGWAVHNVQGLAIGAGDRLNIADGLRGAPIMAVTRPVRGPFPPTDRPNDPPPLASGAPAPGAVPGAAPGAAPGGAPATAPPCVPVLLAYGICCDIDVDIFFPLLPETIAVTDAFNSRGYSTQRWTAGARGTDGQVTDTLEEAMDRLEAAIGTHPTYCQCPEDQLVIFIAAHGDRGEFQWKPMGGRAQRIPYTRLMDRLARIAAIAGNPAKTYFIMLGCRSGTIFDDGVIPRSLRGMHLLTSAPNGNDLSYGSTFGKWLPDELANPKVNTWSDLIDTIKGDYRSTAGDKKSRPRNGDVNGCWAQLRLKSVNYVGQDVGVLSRWRVTILGRQVTEDNLNLVLGGVLQPNTVIHDGFFGDCGRSVRIEYAVTAVVGGYSTDTQTGNVNFQCNNTAVTAHSIIIVNDGSKMAQFLFTFELTPSGC